MVASVRPSGSSLRRLLASSRQASHTSYNLPRAAIPSLHQAHEYPTTSRSTQSSSNRSRWHSTTTTSSVNPDEVSHFNNLAADWWNPHGSSRLLHLMNPLRHDFIAQCRRSTVPAPSPDQKLTYLDIGCGGGIFAESAARLPTTKSVLAIDPTPQVLGVAKAHAKKDPSLADKLEYRLSSIEQLRVPGVVSENPAAAVSGNEQATGYDIVSLFEVIEHIDNPSAFLDQVRPFVKPGGWLVMSTMARTWTSWFTTNFMAEDVLGIVPKGTHDWNKYLNEEELRRYFVDKVGWASPRVMGCMYVPGFGWKVVEGGEKLGNYFFAIRRKD